MISDLRHELQISIFIAMVLIQGSKNLKNFSLFDLMT